MNYKEKLEELYLDEEEILSELVDRSKSLIGISRESGEIIFKVQMEKLNDHQKIILFMLGACFLTDLGRRENKEVTNQELSLFLDKRTEQIGSRLSELRKQKKVKSTGTGKNILIPRNVVEDIADINELI